MQGGERLVDTCYSGLVRMNIEIANGVVDKLRFVSDLVIVEYMASRCYRGRIFVEQHCEVVPFRESIVGVCVAVSSSSAVFSERRSISSDKNCRYSVTRISPLKRFLKADEFSSLVVCKH